jgi:hypothetical protein
VENPTEMVLLVLLYGIISLIIMLVSGRIEISMDVATIPTLMECWKKVFGK